MAGSRAAGLLLHEEEHRPDGAPHGAQLTRCCHLPGAELVQKYVVVIKVLLVTNGPWIWPWCGSDTSRWVMARLRLA